jgi:quercetin dioxygenase-like cupin family protein
MARRSAIEELDDAVGALMADPHAPLPPFGPRLTALLRVAADLVDLPSPDFKARLKAELLSVAARGAGEPAAAPPSAGPPLATAEDVRARLEELAEQPRLVAHDVRAALSGLPEMTMRFLASLDQCTLGVSRLSTPSHWERHPAGDEMLHILEGEVDITVLTDGEPVHSTARAGSIFVCPRGLWHRLRPRAPVSLFFATPGEGVEHSTAEDPRPTRRGRRSGRRGTAEHPSRGARALEAHDIGAALSDLPELTWRGLASLNQCRIGLFRLSGESPWERHPGGDELLHALDGEVEVTVLTDGGPVHTTVRAGSVFVCPRGLWHRQRARGAVTHLYASPLEGTEHSWAEDPRGER